MNNEPGLQLKYFVLNPNKHDDYGIASRLAMMAYADSIQKHNPTLSTGILMWVESIELDEERMANDNN